jgi:hypothetical protein
MRRRRRLGQGRRMLENTVKTWSRKLDSHACGFQLNRNW